MIMIPLPFLIAAAAFVWLIREWLNGQTGERNHWFLGFLAVLIFQEILIGVRFGYGYERLHELQPVTASMLPPLAYLAFKRPPIAKGLLLHAIPLAVILLVIFGLWNFMDTFLALNNLFYAMALMILGLGGSDALGWVKIGNSNLVLALLWLVCAVLIISGMTDVLIAYDFWINEGANTGDIVGWTTLIGIISIAVITTVAFFRTKHFTKIAKNTSSTTDKKVFGDLENILLKDKLFLDPDINLNRISRRLTLPVRDVSQAVNRTTGESLSQYINGKRIDEACRLLRDSKMQITQIIYASGFNTKSNFNREFARVTDMTPSQWRKENG